MVIRRNTLILAGLALACWTVAIVSFRLLLTSL